MNFDEAILNTAKGFENTEGDDAKNKILYSRWETRYCKTIKDFYESFIEPRLPSADICIKWNELLKWYLDQPNAIYFYRGGNTPTKCRRGWLCEQGNSSNNELIRFIYDDNDLACYIYKMALDGFCPSNSDFLEYMTFFKDASQIKWIGNDKLSKVDKTRKYLSFPGKFTPNENYENSKNILFLYDVSPTCCLGKYNYKHAHVFDVKGEYTINHRVISERNAKVKDDVLKTFDIDHNDLKKYDIDPVLGVFVYKKDKVNINLFNEIKQFLKAETMRFLNPLNHFLSPMSKCNKYTKSDGAIDLDIAEYDHLQKYIIFRKRELFNTQNRPNIYKEYENYILPAETLVSFSDEESKRFGDENINIIFHEKSISDSTIFKGYKNKDGYDTALSKLRAKGKTNKQKTSNGKANNPNQSNGSKYIDFKGEKYNYRDYVLEATKEYIKTSNIQSLSELLDAFPGIATLASSIPVNNEHRWHKEEIDLPNGDRIRITNQISRGAGSSKKDINHLQPKFESFGIK